MFAYLGLSYNFTNYILYFINFNSFLFIFTSFIKRDSLFFSVGNGEPEKDVPIRSDEELAETIDFALSTVDLNNDGYIDYSEFMSTQEVPSPPK